MSYLFQQRFQPSVIVKYPAVRQLVLHARVCFNAGAVGNSNERNLVRPQFFNDKTYRFGRFIFEMESSENRVNGQLEKLHGRFDDIRNSPVLTAADNDQRLVVDHDEKLLIPEIVVFP